MLRSIRWTLQIWHAAILALALATLGTTLYLAVGREQRNRVDAELEGAAMVLANGPLVQPFGDGGRAGRRSPPREGPGSPDANNRGPIGPEGMRRRGPYMDMGRGPGGPPGPPPFDPQWPPMGDPATRFLDEWWTQVREDALRRIGQREQDQPYFVVWGLRGEVLRASSPDLGVPPPAGPAVPWMGPGMVGSPEFRQRGLMREVILQGPFGVRLLVGKSLLSEAATLRRLCWQLLGAGAAVMAVGLAGGWLLSRRVLRPIEQISRTAKAISGSDLSSRVPVEESASELGSLAQTLNETFERLDAAFQRQVRFTADASHELRTPLAVIHSHAELALTKERTAPEYRQSLETCLRAAKRTRSLVDALLVLARADAGRLQLKMERFDLRDAAEECLALVASRAQERNVTLDKDLGEVVLEADRTRVMQLITNLLVNAIQYNKEGGRVTLSVAEEGTEAVLKVADTGIGMGQEDQAHVFERFFRADKARSREAGGSGLGLAICRSIVEAHHGTISFTSEPGKGTTFTVRLPVVSGGQTSISAPGSGPHAV
ncbi:MAG: HAMP domain-containing histidine kinase [Phycisphaerae bacterium]|nr:HAMP domain-containing histidine kinase [Phycisphaerae bacterium]